MTLELPNLDDRAYADLVQEALGLIPTYAPDWTNYNPSDPGITTIELFAYLSEMLIYRLNRVTDANKQAFLNLIGGQEDSPPLEGDALNEEIRQVINSLRESDRAVTAADFECLAFKADGRVARALCLPRRNLLSENPLNPEDRPGHVSLVVVPTNPGGADIPLQPASDLLEAVSSYLEPRRLLTTKVHVCCPRYVAFRLRLNVALRPDIVDREETVKPKILEAVRAFFGPRRGGGEGKGWEFGRNVFVSEIYELLDRQPEVDYVTSRLDGSTGRELPEIVVPPGESSRLEVDGGGRLVALEIRSDELPDGQQIQLSDLFL